MASEQQITDLLKAVHQKGEALTEVKAEIHSLKSSFSIIDSQLNRILSLLGYSHQQIREEIHSEELTVEEAVIPEETKTEELFEAAELIIDSFDSLDWELIPQFFFVEIGEDDDCLDVEFLIPSFFFDEEDDLPDALNFQSKEIGSSAVAEPERSKELVISNSKLIGKTCFTLLFDDSRIILDPGKVFKLINKFGFDSIASCSLALYNCPLPMANYNGNFVHEPVNKQGYHSDGLFSETVASILSKGDAIGTACLLFDKIPESASWNFWSMGVDYFLQLQMYKVPYNDVCIYLVIDSSHSVFDRGKEIDLIIWVSCFPPFDFTFEHQMQVWFLYFVLFVWTTLGDNDDGSKLLANLSRRENLTNCLLMFLWMRVGGVQHAYICLYGYAWVNFSRFDLSPSMCGVAIFLLQLKCGLFFGITIQSCALLFFSPTCLLGLQFILEALFLDVLRSTMDHGHWFKPYLASVGRVCSLLLEVVSSTTEVVGIHVHTSMVLLIASSGCFLFFRLFLVIAHMDTSSFQVVALIKCTHWVYDRGKLSSSQGYFSFAATYAFCLVTVAYVIIVILVPKWMADYEYESVYGLIMEFGYHLILLFECSNVSLLAANGDTRSVCELSDEVPERNVSRTMLLVWKGATKRCTFMCYFCCDVCNLRAKSARTLSVNTSTVYSHRFCQVKIQVSPSHVLLPSDTCGNCFAGLLMRDYISANIEFTHLLQVLISAGDSVEFRVFSRTASLKVLIRHFRLLVTGLFPPSPSLSPAICETFVVLVELVYATMLEFLAVLSGTQVLLNVIQNLNVLMWFEYLRWKFRVVPTGWCSTRNIGLGFISVVCFDLNWYRSKLFWEAEVHNQLAVILKREESWHLGSAIRTTSYNGTKIPLRMRSNHRNTVESSFPIALLLVVSMKCNGATNDAAQLSGVLMCNSCQVGNCDGKTTRSIFTEFLAFVFLTVITSIVIICSKVLEQLKVKLWVTVKCVATGEFLEARLVAETLHHLFIYRFMVANARDVSLSAYQEGRDEDSTLVDLRKVSNRMSVPQVDFIARATPWCGHVPWQLVGQLMTGSGIDVLQDITRYATILWQFIYSCMSERATTTTMSTGWRGPFHCKTQSLLITHALFSKGLSVLTLLSLR